MNITITYIIFQEQYMPDTSSKNIKKMYQHVKHSGWGIHWNDINTGRLILQYFVSGTTCPKYGRDQFHSFESDLSKS